MLKNKTKIVFFGTPQFAVPALESLINEEYDVVAVITQPDKEVGRKKIFTPSPIKLFSQKHNIKALEPKSLKSDEFFEEFKNLNPDLAIVAAYGKIIPQKVLDVPKHGFINIHPSLLPKYRGPSPIQTVLLNGDKESGVSIMVVDEQVDHGPVLVQEKYDIWPKTTFKQLNEELAKLGARMLVQSIPDWINGKNKGNEQNHNQATFTKMFSRGDGKIDWLVAAEKIFNQIRALSDEPGVWTTFNGKILNIKKSELIEISAKEIPGTVLKIDGKIMVTAKINAILMIDIQPEGGKIMDASAFANGQRDFVGSRLD